jgi:hypothetical protein
MSMPDIDKNEKGNEVNEVTKRGCGRVVTGRGEVKSGDREREV